MNRVHKIADRGFNEIPLVAIGVKRDRMDNHHLSILYRTPVEFDIMMFHQCWDLDTRLQSPEPESCDLWVHPNIDPDIGELLIGYIHSTGTKASQRPFHYGFDDFRKCLKLDGEYNSTEDSTGMTCSTLVLAVFYTCNCHLVIYESWPQRQEDIIWRTNVLRAYISTHRDEMRMIRCLQEQIDTSIRFRPLEVGGSASSEILPVAFGDAVKLAEEIGTLLPVISV